MGKLRKKPTEELATPIRSVSFYYGGKEFRTSPDIYAKKYEFSWEEDLSFTLFMDDCFGAVSVWDNEEGSFRVATTQLPDVDTFLSKDPKFLCYEEDYNAAWGDCRITEMDVFVGGQLIPPVTYGNKDNLNKLEYDEWDNYNWAMFQI